MNKRVMVVDDSDFVRERMIQRLEMEGFETVSARNGVEAVTFYKEEPVNVVFMDITMPKLDGLGALSEIRAFDPKATVIMLTAINQTAMITRAIHLGAKDYLTKPVTSPQLLDTLSKILGSSNAAY